MFNFELKKHIRKAHFCGFDDVVKREMFSLFLKKPHDHYKWDDLAIAFGLILPDLIESLKVPDSDVILYAFGDFTDYEMIPILHHICNTENYGRYYIKELFKPYGKGYIYGSVSFDYDIELMKTMLSDNNVSFQMATSLAGAILDKKYTEEAIRLNIFDKEDLKRIIDIGTTFLNWMEIFLVYTSSRTSILRMNYWEIYC